jgi:hypothetical protein
MITLTALKGSSPIGAMAAYGVLRVLHLQGTDARLLFDPETSQASIDVTLDDQGLIGVIREYVARVDCAPGFMVPVNGEDILKSEFGPALYCEKKDKGGSKIDKTVFNRVAGSDNVLNLARKAREEILKTTKKSKPPEENIREALFGPWLQNDDIAAFGWNPADKKEAASLAGNRVPKVLPQRTVVGANWLAFESLPLLAPIALIAVKNEWNYPLPARASFQEACALMYGFSGLKERDLQVMGVAVYRSKAEYYSQSASCFTESTRVA